MDRGLVFIVAAFLVIGGLDMISKGLPLQGVLLVALAVIAFAILAIVFLFEKRRRKNRG